MTPQMTEYIQANQPCSALQVAQAMGITRQSFYEQYHKGNMHIVEWVRVRNGQPTGMYELGPGKDAPKPKTIGVKERQQAYQKRHRMIIRAKRPGVKLLQMGVWSGLMGVGA